MQNSPHFFFDEIHNAPTPQFLLSVCAIAIPFPRCQSFNRSSVHARVPPALVYESIRAASQSFDDVLQATARN